jgi:Flp pilus assembly protein TadG
MTYGRIGRSVRKKGDQADEGAALVEFALVLPILILVLISIFEIGAAFRSYLTVSYLAREGARMSAFLGTDINADCTMVTSIATQMTPADFANLVRIEVFRADSAGNQVVGDTNTFTFTGTDKTNCAHWSKVITWDSTTRQTEVSSTGTPPLDVIGVRIVATKSWMTGFPPYRGTYTVNENTIVRMEPEAFA